MCEPVDRPNSRTNRDPTVLYICICLPYDFFGNQTTAHPAEKVCAAASLANPSLHGLGSSIVKLVAELSLTYKSVWQAALCQPMGFGGL